MQIVKDLMVPLEAYTRVHAEASLREAIAAMREAMQGSAAGPSRPKDRAVLVQAADGRIVGELGLGDLLRGLEPRYAVPFNWAPLVDEYFTWTHSMFANLAGKAGSVHAKNLLREHTQEEFIDEDAQIDVAVHQLVHGGYNALLVKRGEEIVGVLRLSDVFLAVSEMIDAAEQKTA